MFIFSILKNKNITYNEDRTKNFDILTADNNKSTLIVNNRNQTICYSNNNLEYVGDDFYITVNQFQKLIFQTLRLQEIVL